MTDNNLNIDNFREDENPFRVPSGYFKESRANIMDAIKNEMAEKPVRRLNVKPMLLWISGVAAMLVIGMILFQNLYIKPNSDVQLAQEIEWFINSSGPDLDIGTLASYIVDEGITFEEANIDTYDDENSSLLELTDYDELFIIEEWMKSENQQK